MRKPTKKLAVRRETLRVLANAELLHAAGGERLGHGSDDKGCFALAEAIVKPGG